MKLSVACSVVFSLLGSCASESIPNENELESRQAYPPISYFSSTLISPKTVITKSGAALAPGYIFLAPQTGTYRPLILTDDGELVWTTPLSSTAYKGTDLRKQQLNGEDVLTFYKSYGDSGRGFSYGSTQVMDNTYKIITEICPQLGLYVPFTKNTPKCQGDLHEQQFTSDNTLLVTAYNVTQADLTSQGGGANGWVVEAQFYELALDGSILFSWKSLNHVPVSKGKNSVTDPTGQNETVPYDYFHINSVQKIDNQYLINGRNVWSSYLIGSNGDVIWSFDGATGGSFGPLPNAPTGDSQHLFAYEHHVRGTKVGDDSMEVTLFNNDLNYIYSNTGNPSTGLSFLLNTTDMTSKLLHDYYDPNDAQPSVAEGSYSTLSNGNVLLEYGNLPVLKEFGPNDNNDVRMTFRYGPGPRYGSYRAYKYEWVGAPTTKPAVAVKSDTGLGYVSWNGATEVTRYVINVGTQKNLKMFSSVQKAGFETSFDLPPVKKTGKYIRVDAYNGDQLLAKSLVTKYA